MTVKRVTLGVRYDGSAYRGWQTQDNVPSVQERLERALSRVANHTVNLVCAGRTDAGVHATGQVVHFDTEADRSDYSWVFGANSNLPNDISIIWGKEVPMEFHARFSAQGRRYRYVLLNQDVRPGILRHSVGWFYKTLDVERMQEAANYLVGEHDFSAYRGSGCEAKTTVRTMYSLDITRRGRMVIIEAHGNAFLMHMVRNITGVLIEVGVGRQEPIWAKEVLDSRDRREGGRTISPRGLYLVGVDYSTEYELPKMPLGPFFLP